MLKSFLTNKTINSLNFHFGLQSFANSFGSLFIGVFLYQAGIPIWQIFIALAASMILRVAIRPISLQLCTHYGPKKIMIIGTVLYALNYPILGQIESIDPWFYFFFFIFTLTDILYWLPYHTMYAVLGDNEHRGKQTGLRDGMIKVFESIGPLVSGILVITYGYWAAFAAAMFFMLISIIPLIKIPEIDLSKYTHNKKSKQIIEKEGFWIYIGDGFFYNQDFVWKLVLFLILLNPAHFGGLIGLAILFQFLLHILVGHLFDKGKGKPLAMTGTILLALSVLGRGLFANTITEIIFLDIIFAIGFTLYMPVFNSALYNLAHSSKNPLKFHYYAETGWDIGSILASLMTALIVYISDDLRLAMMLSLAGLLVTNYILRKYFRKT